MSEADRVLENIRKRAGHPFEKFRDELIFAYSTRYGRSNGLDISENGECEPMPLPGNSEGEEIGVSSGIYESMNLSSKMGDDSRNVQENYRIWCRSLGTDASRLAFGHQTHTCNVLAVDEKSRGASLGYDQPSEVHDVDGLITDQPETALCTGHADCTPLYFYCSKAPDSASGRAAGMTHAGWRGTVAGIAGVTVRALSSEYGCRPEDIYAMIGPVMSQEHFESDADVVEAIRAMKGSNSHAYALGRKDENGVRHPEKAYDQGNEPYYSRLYSDYNYSAGFNASAGWYYDEESGKYHISLACINALVLIDAGILPEHIDLRDECTFEAADKYFSHRRQGSKRGGNAALIEMSL